MLQQLGRNVLVADRDERSDQVAAIGRRVGQVFQQHGDGPGISSSQQQRIHRVVRGSCFEPFQHVFYRELLTLAIGPRDKNRQCGVSPCRVAASYRFLEHCHQAGVTDLGQGLHRDQRERGVGFGIRGEAVDGVGEGRTRVLCHGADDFLAGLDVGLGQHLQQALVSSGVPRGGQAIKRRDRETRLILQGQAAEAANGRGFPEMSQADGCRLGDHLRVVIRERQQQRQVLGSQSTAAPGQGRRSCQRIALPDLLEQFATWQYPVGGGQRRGHRVFDRLVHAHPIVERVRRHRFLDHHDPGNVPADGGTGSRTVALIGNGGEVQFANSRRDSWEWSVARGGALSGQ